MSGRSPWKTPPYQRAQGSSPAPDPSSSSSTTLAPSAYFSIPQVPQVMDPALQAAMAAFFTLMTQQVRTQVAVPQAANLPVPVQNHLHPNFSSQRLSHLARTTRQVIQIHPMTFRILFLPIPSLFLGRHFRTTKPGCWGNPWVQAQHFCCKTGP